MSSVVEAASFAGGLTAFLATVAATGSPLKSSARDVRSQNSLFRDCLASGYANAFASALLNPVDICKTRMQVEVRNHGQSPRFGSLASALRALYAEAGLKGIWLPGLTATMMREMVGGSIRGGVYLPVRDYLSSFNTTMNGDAQGGGSLMVRGSAAIISGAIGGVFSNPIEIIKIRLLASSQRYCTTFEAFPTLFKEEGFSGCVRGMGTSVLRASVINAGYLGTYDHAKHTLKSYLGGEDGPRFHVAASLISGLIATTVAAPFDMLKTRIMTSSDRTTVEILRFTVAKEGMLSLFRGWLPAYLRIGPHALISFPVLEEVRRRLGLSYI